MGPLYYDRVWETTTTTGTGTLTLLGAEKSGYQSFGVVGDANTCYYAISDTANNAYEVGLGTYTLSGTTLARTTVLASSNSGSLVSFAAGTKDVFLVVPAKIFALNAGQWLFGAGVDGVLTFDGSTTILGMIPSGNVYTLTRSIYPSAMTVNTGVRVKTVGYRIHCSGTLTTSGTGAISNDGAVGNNAVTTTGGGANSGLTAAELGGSSAGGAGGVGGNAGGGGGGTTGATLAAGAGGQGAAGGAAGAGVNAAGFVGSAGPITTAQVFNFFTPLVAIYGASLTLVGGGSGGGGGAGGGSGSTGSRGGGGGGGGAGGGVCWVAALTVSNAGSISANGGNGGNGGNAGAASAGNGGGAGGGGGGQLMLAYQTLTGAGTITANGGTGGNAGTGGGGGATGGTGGVGVVLKYNFTTQAFQ